MAQTRHSSFSETFSSISSLDDELSLLVLGPGRPPSSQFVAAKSNQSWQPNAPKAPSPRPATPSYYSSSDEDLSSISGMLDEDFSHMDDETPQSSQSIAKDKQLAPPRPRTEEPSGCDDVSMPTTPVPELEVVSPIYGSPSSTGKLSWPSPTLTATHSTSSTSTPSPKSPRSPRLYRTRSGNLASVAELRQRRQQEDEVLDTVLRGIKVLREVQKPLSHRSVAMSPDESGRWRINSIREDWGP
ncbi:hypothetical protein F5Y03DRAFT_369540 [Xylaria venustula]|nr:hypothetical protein F5Y03DRAFT_369540 [Xylaria venustula]